jgi:EmrB/QacA subfamily drug resistance transporter
VLLSVFDHGNSLPRLMMLIVMAMVTAMSTITAASTITKDETNRNPAHQGLALLSVLLAQALIAIDATIVNVALPSIGRDFHMGQTSLSWVVSAYLITFGSFLLLAGRLGDLLGRARVLTAGIALFVAASLVCGLSPSGGFLIGARFVQGLGAALTSAVILALITIMRPDPEQRAKAMSSYMLVSIGGGSVALLAGGSLTEFVDWRWIFLINLPVGLASLALIRRYVPRDRGLGLDGGIDWLGGLLVTASAIALVLAIVEAPTAGILSAETIGLVAGALVLAGAFVMLESRLEKPLLPLRVLRSRSLMAGSAVRALIIGSLYAAFFFGALLFQRILGFGTFEVGLAFLPQTVVVAALSLGLTGRLVKAIGPLRTLLAGLAATAAGLALFAIAGPDTSYAPTLLLGCMLLGLGVGLAIMPVLTIVMADAEPSEAGLVSGLTTASMYLGGSLMLAVLTALATARTNAVSGHAATPDAADLTSGYALAFWVAVGLLGVAALVAVAFLRERRPRGAQ